MSRATAQERYFFTVILASSHDVGPRLAVVGRVPTFRVGRTDRCRIEPSASTTVVLGQSGERVREGWPPNLGRTRSCERVRGLTRAPEMPRSARNTCIVGHLAR